MQQAEGRCLKPLTFGDYDAFENPEWNLNGLMHECSAEQKPLSSNPEVCSHLSLKIDRDWTATLALNLCSMGVA